LQVKKEGFKLFGMELEIDAGGRRPIIVGLETDPASAKPERERQQALEEERERERQRRQRLDEERQRAEEERRRQQAQELAAAEKAKREKEEAAEKAKKERQEKEAAEAENRKRDATEVERQRQNDLESRGLAYYPQPKAVFRDKNAQEWYDHLMARPTDQIIRQRTIGALAALKDEGMPFMVKLLQTNQKENLPTAIDSVLRAMKPEFIHFNDLHVIVDCLDDKHCKDFTRMLALEHLAKRKESKKHLKRIKALADDLMESEKHQAKAKELVDAIGAK
jgi:hypothetical protein